MKKSRVNTLESRMKQYEATTDISLVPKMPIVIRLDGKAFHTYTKGMKKPFDDILSETMIETTKALCKDVHSCVFGYTQSDEITLILRLPDKIKSEAYYNGRLEKIVSLTASKATRYFNKIFYEKVIKFKKLTEYTERRQRRLLEEAAENCNDDSFKEFQENEIVLSSLEENKALIKAYLKRAGDAEFDCRAWNMPEWDCINSIVWRQKDAIRNSVEAVGHANFSQSELYKLSVEEIKEKLLNEKGINWEEDFNVHQKMGVFCYKVIKTKEVAGENDEERKVIKRRYWETNRDNEMRITENRDWFAEVTGLSEK